MGLWHRMLGGRSTVRRGRAGRDVIVRPCRWAGVGVLGAVLLSGCASSDTEELPEAFECAVSYRPYDAPADAVDEQRTVRVEGSADPAGDEVTATFSDVVFAAAYWSSRTEGQVRVHLRSPDGALHREVTYVGPDTDSVAGRLGTVPSVREPELEYSCEAVL